MSHAQMSPVVMGDPIDVGRAQAYQARRMEYIRSGDLTGLVSNLYTRDARLCGFDFCATGDLAIQSMIALVQRRAAGLGQARILRFNAGRDFIWQELSMDSPAGATEPYEVKFLRDGRVYLQLFGFKQGSLWQPGDLNSFAPPLEDAGAEAWHQRYIDYQVRQDADGLADRFFAADGRLVTAKQSIAGRENLRSFYQHKFQTESDFHLVSTRNVTGAQDFAWFEATAGGSLGIRTVYEVLLLQAGRVSLQIVGTLAGILPSNGADTRSETPHA